MKNVCAALVKAQKQFGPALKDKTNPAFRSKYADLGACLDAVIDSLNNNGIALIQRTLECADGVTIETVFVHESGEQMSSGPLHVPATKHDAQGYGSALTYARRYSLMAACGIAPEDDDGNAAAKAKPRIDTFAAHGKPMQESADAARTVIPERRQGELDEMSLNLSASHRRGQDMVAIAAYYSLLDNEEKVYVWHNLQAESKLRTLIKANAPATGKGGAQIGGKGAQAAVYQTAET